MGLSPSFPITKKPPCYLVSSTYSSTGNPITDAQEEMGSTEMHKPMLNFMQEYIQQRCEINEAKLKFHEIDIAKLKRRYPHWNVEDITDFRAQFQSFDINGDGLIDFRELCAGLDELGDNSSHEERKKHFTSLDVDNSGAVDFEEYLDLVNVLLKSKKNDVLYKSDVTPRNIRRLSVIKRIEHGLF